MDIYNRELAKIKKFHLNIKDRGILVFHIDVDYESGCSQSVGGLCLDEFVVNPCYDSGDRDSSRGERVGTAYGCEMIRQLMLTLDVNSFDDARDKLIYVLGEGEGLSFKPMGIQTLSVYGKVKTLIFDDIAEQFKLEKEHQ